MNKVFKIVFNAARGKMMVVNEATSSVQTGKKAAVTVAVVAALASGMAVAAAPDFDSNNIVIDGNRLVENHTTADSFQQIFKEVNTSVTGSGVGASLTFDTRIPVKHEAIRIWGNGLNLNIQDLDLLSIQGTGFLMSQITVGTVDDSSALFAGGNGTINVNVKTFKVGSETEVSAYGLGLNGQGGHINVNATDVFMNLDGNAVWAQPTTANHSNVSVQATNDITLKSANYAAVASFLIQKNTTAESSVTVNAGNKLSITSEGGADAAVSVKAWNEGSTSVSLSGKNGVEIDCENGYGVRINQQVNSQSVSTDIKIQSDSGQIEVSGADGSVIITNANAGATAEAWFKAPEITLNGAVDLIGANSKLTLNGATTINGDVSVGDKAQLVLNGETVLDGVADIQGTLAGNGQLLINTKDSAIKLSGDTNVTVGTTGELTDKLGGNVQEVADNFEGVEQIVMQEGDVIGQVTAKLADGKVVEGSIKQAVNAKTEALAEQVTLAPQMITRIMMNDVRKRMGDLRAAEGTHGVWARYNGGQMAGSGMESDFHMVQVGVDTVPVADAPRFGVAFSYAQSEAEATNGLATTDMDSFSLAFYGTKMYDNGMFVDVIGRMATMDSEMKVLGNEAKMDNIALSLSGEFGWRFDVNDKFFFEPSVEATYTYTNAETFKMGAGTYELEAVDSLVGRAGFAAGFKCPANKGDVYVRAAVVHEFMGDSTMNSWTANGVAAVPVVMDGKDTWFEYAIGANFNVNKNTYVYADVERTSGANVDEDWRANVGVRFAF